MLYFRNLLALLFSLTFYQKHFRNAQKDIKMKQGGLGIDKMTLFVKAKYLMDDIIRQ